MCYNGYVMIMKKNGFTLVELLVCILLLGVITTSVTLGIIKSMNAQKEEQYSIYKETIENAACTYAETNNLRDERCLDKSNCQITDIPVENIVGAGLLDENLENPNDSTKSLTGDIVIEWKENEKICTYTE